MDNVTKALALARLGIKVFPVSVATRAPAIPEKEGGRGFYDATSDDFEKIATWFTLDYADNEQYAVGYWAGGSGLLIEDLDRGKKNGKDGFKSVADQGREIGDTYFYRTRSGGEHHIFQTDRLDLTLSADHDGLEGVDVRAGGSYAVWWGNEVPESRDVFSTEIPEWLTKAVDKDEFTGEGFSGTISEWLLTVSEDALPSMRTRDMIGRIPAGQFGHPEMVDLAWAIVRLGSERETGIKMALDVLRKAWLREPYNTPKFRRDLDLALRGAINKAGRIQKPVPSMPPLTAALSAAKQADVYDELTAVERRVSETASEIDLARARREMFALAAEAGMKAGAALGVVTGSRAFKQSKVTVESAWFGDGESEFNAVEEPDEFDEPDEEEDEEEKAKKKLEKLVARLSSDSQAFSLLDATEKALLETAPYKWFGDEYLDFIEAQLKHFNKPYHVSMLWAALSVIASPWGKVPLPGAKAVDVNLYLFSGGDSSTGKTEAVEYGTELVDAVYGKEFTPLRGDISKLSALALHRDLIMRDGKPSLIFGDEIQSFFEGVQGSQWQNGILGDVSSHYGGNVSPKLTLNDKDISGKRAKTMLTSYLTGIADQTLAAVSLKQWTSGFFYRFLWSFGNPRITGDNSFKMKSSTASYTAQFEVWAKELKRVGALQEVRWGAGREVYWDEDAEKRMERLKEQIEAETIGSPLFDLVYANANTRFTTSIAKVATIVAMVEASETVTLKHVLIALSYAGPWHRSMVLAVEETAKEPFDREAEACLDWIRRNAIEQIGKPPWIQETAVYRAFKPNETAERLLRQLSKEGWIMKSGDKYELSAE
jgi:hypothetical protein